MAAMLTSGTNVTLSYDDAAGTLSVTAAGGDAEVMRDTIGAALVGINGVTVTVNDALDTITLAITGLAIAQVTGLQGALDGKAPTLGSDDNYVTDTEKAALHSHSNKAALDAVSGTNTGDQDLSGYALAAQTINAQTGTSYTLQASDAGKLVTLTNSAAITVTVPASTFTAGQRVDVAVLGAGMVTLVGSGITLNPEAGLSLVSRAQWSAFTIYFLTATTAFVTGSMAAS